MPNISAVRDRLIQHPIVVLIAAIVAVAAGRAYASGPGAAANFVVMSDGVTDTATSHVTGDIGGFTVQLSDSAKVKGNVIAAAGGGTALDLGDSARVTGKCVTGGGSIQIVPAHPAKCIGGQNTSGTDPLLMEFSNGLNDAATLTSALQALPPTKTLSQIDIAPGTKTIMTFVAGTNVVRLSSGTPRMLIESGAKLILKAPKGASVIFQIGSLFTAQSGAKVVLAGGIKANNVAYVVNTDATLGVSSSVMGTILADGDCMLDGHSHLKGALLCGSSATFGSPVGVTWAPLPSTFP